jgi:hypothetical protein
MRMMPGRRDALTTFALATGAIGFASAAAKPATAPVEPALTPHAAWHCFHVLPQCDMGTGSRLHQSRPQSRQALERRAGRRIDQPY